MPFAGWTPTQGCIDNIKKRKNGRICGDPATHCWDISDYTHQICVCQGQFHGSCTETPEPPPWLTPSPPGCCTYTADSPIPSYDNKGLCYCCCSCFAYDTPIAYAIEGSAPQYRAVQDFAIGDVVLAADTALTWSEVPLQFSEGAPAKKSALIRLDYKIGDEPLSLLVTRGQPVFTPAGKLMRADRLRPGDPLVLADGSGTTPLLSIAAGIFDKGVHHIATTQNAATQIDGHLLNSNGIVTGDFALQISGFDSEPGNAMMAEDHDERPVFGTAAYYAALPGAPPVPDAPGAAYLLAAGDSPDHPTPEGFEAMAGYTPGFPAGTQSYFTDAQAWQLQTSKDRAPPGSSVGSDIAQYIVRLFGGIYPNIAFEFDQRNDVPNAYAFQVYDRKFVVITGGLIRMNPVSLESLAFIAAHCAARLEKLAPTNEDGFSCRGTADWASAGILMYVFIGDLYGDVVTAGFDQLKALFALLGPQTESRGADTCMNISVQCRLSAVQAGFQGGMLPECAGGKPSSTLALTGATAAMGKHGRAVVTLAFSAALDPATVTLPANYSFDPVLSVASATLDPDDSTKVRVEPEDMEPGLSYVVSVLGILSAKGNGLRPSASSTGVELPKTPDSGE